MRFVSIILIFTQIHLYSESYHNPTAPNDSLKYHLGDFTDSDGDGMTDSAEKKYGFDPFNKSSFPKFDLRALPPVEYPIPKSKINNAVIAKSDTGILIKWDEHDLDTGYSKYSLTLNSGNHELYYGGHSWGTALVDYTNFNLIGSETLSGRFSEYNPQNGEFVRDGEWFEIDLSEYPLVIDKDLGSSSDRVTFRFEGFKSELQLKYETFLGKVMPIFMDVAGFPAETFVCTFKLAGSGNSWMTLDQGRTVWMDESWIPRLFIHELIHVWKGKYAFSYTGESWSYEEKLNGFEEIAEGLAYEILQEYVEAYPHDETSLEILQNGPWWHWSSQASNYDTVKHQPHTGAGTFWSGENLFQNDRYSISAMLIQIIHAHDPGFFKKTMQAYYRLIETNPEYRPTREGLLDLWSSQIQKINGIESRTYLNALPVLNGEQLAQRYFPVIYQSEPYSYGTTKVIFGSYALEGNLWWYSGNTPAEIGAYNVPSWVKYHQNEDGYLYVDSNNQPYHVTVENIFGETTREYEGVLDTGYQDEQKTIPNNLFSERISELDSSNLPTGLYIETLTFTDLVKHTEYAAQSFYTFGYQSFEQSPEEYSLFIGIDSKFPSRLEVTFEDHFFDLPVVNGCAVLKTSLFPHNTRGILSIKAHSENGESQTYQRALVNAGSYDGKKHQQFLIIDRDFDGVEDLYDQIINEADIAARYKELNKKNAEKPVTPQIFSVQVNDVEGGEIMGAGEYNEGEKVTLSAFPLEGYRFEGWSGDLNGSNPNLKHVISKDIRVGAIFSLISSQENKNAEKPVTPKIFSVQVNDVEGGEIMGAGEYNEGEKVTLSAFPLEGYRFEGWSGDLNGSNPNLKHVISKDIRVGAIFAIALNHENTSPVPFWLRGQDKGNNWMHLEWFGYYYLINPSSSWIYHSQFRWVYLVDKNSDSFWGYIEGLGWVWSKQDFFPAVYHSDGKKWIFLSKDRYFDYTMGEWIK